MVILTEVGLKIFLLTLSYHIENILGKVALSRRVGEQVSPLNLQIGEMQDLTLKT